MTKANRERAARALDTLKAYAKLDGQEMESTDTVDLLTDLMHLHGPEAFDHALSSARMHHDVESNEEAE